MNAKSFQVDSVDQLRREITSAKSGGFEATLAIVFLGLNHDAAGVGKVFSDNDIQLIAGNSWGEFVDGKIVSDTIAVMLLDLDPNAFYVRLDDIGDHKEEEVTAIVALEALERFQHPSFIILTGRI